MTDTTVRLEISAAQLRIYISEQLTSHYSPDDPLALFSGPQSGREDEWFEDQLFRFLFEGCSLSEDEVNGLVDPGLLGFDSNVATIHASLFAILAEEIRAWAAQQSWAVANRQESTQQVDPPDLWYPGKGGITEPTAYFGARTSASIRAALKLLNTGRPLQDLDWKSFELLLADLLSADGWKVERTPDTRDGGVDVLARKDDPHLGSIFTVWQAKRYSSSNKVRLSAVRELFASRVNHNATKAIIVTTGSLTRDALAYVHQHSYVLGAKQREDVESWIRRQGR